MLALYSGLRCRELMGLQWDDVDCQTGSLQVRRQVASVGGRLTVQEAKTGQGSRVLGLDAELVDLLARHRAAQEGRPGPLTVAGRQVPRGRRVFPALTGGLMPPLNFVQRHFRPLESRAGLPQGLRHTFATLAAPGGVPMHVTARQLGHSTTRMTAEVYSHVLPEMQREVVRRVRAVVERNDTQQHNTQDHS
ncbi:MAG: site-specific integrase [Thermaerobacter sp.]|nr:site-specific integrase [Thermaerobacter sp.]